MAEVSYGPVMKTAPGKAPKRALGALGESTNTHVDGASPPRKVKKKEEAEDEIVFEWTEKDMRDSKPHSDATEESQVARRTYDLRLVLQKIHAPHIAEDVTFYEIEAPNAAKAAKARQSGEGLTFEPTPEHPLRWPPVDGGVSRAMHVPETSSDIVGVNEGRSAGAKNSNEVQARKKQGRGKGGPQSRGQKGMTFAPSFTVKFDGELVGKYEGRWQSALPDIKRKRPGEDFTRDMLQCMLGIKRQPLLRRYPSLKKKVEDSKFTAKYDD